jgi:hypothetical protein
VLRGFWGRAGAVHSDAGAGLRQGCGDGCAEAARRAGDESGFAFEVESGENRFFMDRFLGDRFFVGQGNRVLSERCRLVTLLYVLCLSRAVDRIQKWPQN